MTTTNIITSDKFKHYTSEVDYLGKQSCEVLMQLEIIMAVIKEKSEKDPTIRRLAKAGEYLAGDHANSIDCYREQIVDEMKKEF